MKRIIIIGGGAAGMMAAITAANEGSKVILIEKNPKLGKKLFITGKGRCNITNACEIEELFQAIPTNSKFLYSSFYTMSNEQVIDFFNQHGCPVKIERGNRAFPVSDKSSDVIRALEREMQNLGVEVCYSSQCKSLLLKADECNGVILTNGKTIQGDAVIIATGGKSYQSTGSTGDGYRLAQMAGHTIVQPAPSLVPIETKSTEPKEMMGLSLKNVEVSFYLKSNPKKVIYREFGEMLFTHFGVSGPLILSGSSYLHPYWKKGPVMLRINLKPALSEKQLDERIQRDFQKNCNSYFKNSLNQLLPKTMIPIVVRRSQIEPERPVHEITKEERLDLVHQIQSFELELKGTRGFEEAIITHGGVKISEVNPSTMESKKVKKLYFAGEVLDLDALTGGYNLQIAWSTGALAGQCAAENDE